MKLLIMAVIIGLLVVGAIVATTLMASANSGQKIACSGCNKSCTADKNCGSPTCGAVQGKTCGCGG